MDAPHGIEKTTGTCDGEKIKEQPKHGVEKMGGRNGGSEWTSGRESQWSK